MNFTPPHLKEPPPSLPQIVDETGVHDPNLSKELGNNTCDLKQEKKPSIRNIVLEPPIQPVQNSGFAPFDQPNSGCYNYSLSTFFSHFPGIQRKIIRSKKFSHFPFQVQDKI